MVKSYCLVNIDPKCCQRAYSFDGVEICRHRSHPLPLGPNREKNPPSLQRIRHGRSNGHSGHELYSVQQRNVPKQQHQQQQQQLHFRLSAPKQLKHFGPKELQRFSISTSKQHLQKPFFRPSTTTQQQPFFKPSTATQQQQQDFSLSTLPSALRNVSFLLCICHWI